MHQLDIDLKCIQLRFLSNDGDIFLELQRSFQPWIDSSLSPNIQLLFKTATTYSISSRHTHFYNHEQQLSIQQEENAWHLTFGQLATICVEPNRLVSTIEMTTAVLQNGRLLDITYTALAPHLRRQGIYLIHAFAAEKNGRCVLIVGPSGSGKTTAGLSLLQDCWSLLGNDVVMVSMIGEDVAVWPTPCHVQLRPESVGLLDGLENGRFPRPRFTANAAKVTHILFPTITTAHPTLLTKSVTATAFARLLTESVDLWDTTTIESQRLLLRKLSMQTAVYELQSGCDIAILPNLIQA